MSESRFLISIGPPKKPAESRQNHEEFPWLFIGLFTAARFLRRSTTVYTRLAKCQSPSF